MEIQYKIGGPDPTCLSSALGFPRPGNFWSIILKVTENSFKTSIEARSRPMARGMQRDDCGVLWRTFSGPRAFFAGLAHFLSVVVTPVADPVPEYMIGLAVACQGTPCIRTHPANYATSAARDFSSLRCRGDLRFGDICETPDDQLDFKRHCPILICLEVRSIGVRIFRKCSRFPKNFRFFNFRKISIEIQLF